MTYSDDSVSTVFYYFFASSYIAAAVICSARNADMEYVPGVTYTVTLDGFITSDNIECTEYENVNTGYSYSDHDPVYMKFKLLDE